MNEEKHTAEPWEIGAGIYIINNCGVSICDFSNSSFVADVNEADALRITLCVNACAGIPTDVLSVPGYSIKAELDTLDTMVDMKCKAEKELRDLRTKLVRGDDGDPIFIDFDAIREALK